MKRKIEELHGVSDISCSLHEISKLVCDREIDSCRSFEDIVRAISRDNLERIIHLLEGLVSMFYTHTKSRSRKKANQEISFFLSQNSQVPPERLVDDFIKLSNFCAFLFEIMINMDKSYPSSSRFPYLANLFSSVYRHLYQMDTGDGFSWINSNLGYLGAEKSETCKSENFLKYCKFVKDITKIFGIISINWDFADTEFAVNLLNSLIGCVTQILDESSKEGTFIDYILYAMSDLFENFHLYFIGKKLKKLHLPEGTSRVLLQCLNLGMEKANNLSDAQSKFVSSCGKLDFKILLQGEKEYISSAHLKPSILELAFEALSLPHQRPNFLLQYLDQRVRLGQLNEFIKEILNFKISTAKNESNFMKFVENPFEDARPSVVAQELLLTLRRKFSLLLFEQKKQILLDIINFIDNYIANLLEESENSSKSESKLIPLYVAFTYYAWLVGELDILHAGADEVINNYQNLINSLNRLQKRLFYNSFSVLVQLYWNILIEISRKHFIEFDFPKNIIALLNTKECSKIPIREKGLLISSYIRHISDYRRKYTDTERLHSVKLVVDFIQLHKGQNYRYLSISFINQLFFVFKILDTCGGIEHSTKMQSQNDFIEQLLIAVSRIHAKSFIISDSQMDKVFSNTLIYVKCNVSQYLVRFTGNVFKLSISNMSEFSSAISKLSLFPWYAVPKASKFAIIDLLARIIDEFKYSIDLSAGASLISFILNISYGDSEMAMFAIKSKGLLEWIVGILPKLESDNELNLSCFLKLVDFAFSSGQTLDSKKSYMVFEGVKSHQDCFHLLYFGTKFLPFNGETDDIIYAKLCDLVSNRNTVTRICFEYLEKMIKAYLENGQHSEKLNLIIEKSFADLNCSRPAITAYLDSLSESWNDLKFVYSLYWKSRCNFRGEECITNRLFRFRNFNIIEFLDFADTPNQIILGVYELLVKNSRFQIVKEEHLKYIFERLGEYTPNKDYNPVILEIYVKILTHRRNLLSNQNISQVMECIITILASEEPREHHMVTQNTTTFAQACHVLTNILSMNSAIKFLPIIVILILRLMENLRCPKNSILDEFSDERNLDVLMSGESFERMCSTLIKSRLRPGMKKHVIHLVVWYIKVQAQPYGPFSSSCLPYLKKSIYYFLDLCTDLEKEIIVTMLDKDQKILFRHIHYAYEQDHKFQG